MNTANTDKSKAKPSAKKAMEGFSDEEIAAMKARKSEFKAARSGKTDGESDVKAAIAAMPEPDRGMGERLHALVRAAAPNLLPKTWYGMPAYANKEGKVVLFFRGPSKFKERYMTLGFNESARLDDGAMWPIAFALIELTAADEKRISALVKQAAS